MADVKKCSKCKEEKSLEGFSKASANKGGPHSMDNCVVSCFHCNSLKCNLDLDEWLERLQDKTMIGGN